MDGTELKASHDSAPEEIAWRDCADVFSPPVRPKQEFIATIHTDVDQPHNTVIFIDSDASDNLHRECEADVSREHGGILLGQPFNDGSGGFYVVIEHAIPAHEAAGSPVHLQFQPESWRHVWKSLSDRPDLHVVGWYHTHPGLGVFLSGTDMRTQRLHFNQPWHLAVVVDPIRKKIGFFIGKDGSRCAAAIFRPKKATQPDQPPEASP